MQCSWNAHALWKIVPSLGAEDTKRWRKGSKFPLARYEAWHLCWCKTRSAKKKEEEVANWFKEELRIPTQACYRHPEERKGKSLATDLPNCNKNSKRRRTLRERELEKWRLSQSDCTAIPTATVFIPALAITGNFRSFPDFFWFTFPSSKAWLSQPKKAGIGLCCRDSRGFLSESLLFSAISTFVDFPTNFAVDWWLWCLSFLLSKKKNSC